MGLGERNWLTVKSLWWGIHLNENRCEERWAGRGFGFASNCGELFWWKLVTCQSCKLKVIPYIQEVVLIQKLCNCVVPLAAYWWAIVTAKVQPTTDGWNKDRNLVWLNYVFDRTCPVVSSLCYFDIWTHPDNPVNSSGDKQAGLNPINFLPQSLSPLLKFPQFILNEEPSASTLTKWNKNKRLPPPVSSLATYLQVPMVHSKWRIISLHSDETKQKQPHLSFVIITIITIINFLPSWLQSILN